MGVEQKHLSSALESIASKLGVMFLREKMDKGGVVQIPSLDSVMFKDTQGQYRLLELLRPNDIDEQTWKKMGFELRRSELISRRAQELVGKVPVAKIEQMIQNELGPLPPDFTVHSSI